MIDEVVVGVRHTIADAHLVGIVVPVLTRPGAIAHDSCTGQLSDQGKRESESRSLHCLLVYLISFFSN